MNIRLIMIIVSYVLFAAILISIPFRKKFSLKKAGKLNYKITGPSSIYFAGIYIISLAVISIMWIRNFGDIMNFILCGCGILACELVTRSFSLKNVYGLYENGLIYDGVYISYDDIIAFPVLILPEEEQKNYDSRTLVLITKSKGQKSFTLISEEEYATVIGKIFEIKPSLKQLIEK